jgi:hypothetical protein
MNKLIALAVLLAAPSFAADKPVKLAVSVTDDPLFKVSFRIKAEDLSEAGSFVIQSGTEADYHVGGEDPLQIDKAVEFKKHNTSVSCIPVTNPTNGLIHAECQFEISGYRRPVGDIKEPPTISFQLKTAFDVRPGKTLLLVDDETRRVEVKIEELKP